MAADPRFFEQLGPRTAAELAHLTGAALVGDGERIVSDVDAPQSAAPASVCFVAVVKAGAGPAEGMQGLAICRDEAFAEACAERTGAALLHPRPQAAWARAAAALLRPRRHEGGALIHPGARIDPAASIAPGAVIGQGADIAEGARIEPGAVIGPGVSVGRHTRVGARVVIMCALIGEGVDISAGAVVGEIGFGLAETPEGLVTLPHCGRVIIEDEVTLGANVTVDRGMIGDTVLKRGARIDNLSQIAHNVIAGPYAVMAAFAGISGSSVIGAGAQLGGRVGVADHVHVGDGARIAAATGLMRDVPAGATWGGYPGQPINDWMRETAWVRRQARKRGKGGTGAE